MKEIIREELRAKKQAYVQEEITVAAAKLFASSGFRAVSIDEIAAQLGYTKSVVYYYFKSKNDVLWSIFEQINDAWAHDMDDITASGASPRDMLWAMVKKHALNVLERTSWTAIYFKEQGNLTVEQIKIVSKRKDVYNDRFKTVYKKGVEQGIFRDIPLPLIVGSIIGMCNWTHDWFKKEGPLTADAISTHFANIIVIGCVVSTSASDGQR